MVGFQFDVLDSKCSSHVGHAHVLLLDLMLVYFTTLSSHIHASSASCKATNLSSKYQHCAPRPDGVRDLDCYRKYPSSATTCVWKPGNHTSDKTYTLIVQQPQKNYCKIYNISKSSTKIQLFGNHNMTVEVFENSNWANCTKDFFRGLPKNLLRCGPPVNVLLKRHSGGLDVDVSWPTSDVKLIINYSLRYKEQGNASWDKAFIHLCDAQSPVESQSGNRCRVGNLDPSLVYVVQMQCVTNSKCTQCPWSQAYTVPPELRTPPAIVDLQDTDIPEKNGRRLVSVTWKFSAEELHDGYSVTVGKMSGEPPQERLNTSEPRIRLVLSYSAYRLDVRAVNNASTSPAARLTIPEREGAKDGRLNVTVHSNTSFTVHWRDSLVQKYVCYCVEWRKKGDKVAYMSFHQNKQNHRDIESLTEPLEPYQRYNITLHTRPDKDTCNLKFFNGSESTYGSTQFYFIEGTPLSAPQNMRSYNVTLTSVVLEWQSIPEEETRGFLLGYIIHFSDYSHRGTGPENNVTVAPELNSYELLGLTSGTTYKVQISGFTSAGAGVRSNGLFITTDHEGYYSLITVFAVVATVLICGTPIIKRAKVVLWPSIPSPGYSNAMQKIVAPCELELLEAFKTLKVEEWDTKSLQIVEKEAVIPASTLPSMLPLLSDSVDEADSAELTCDWFQRDTDDTSGDVLPDDTSLDAPQTVFRSPPFAFPSGYTTLEMLQQVIPQGTPPVDTTEVTESEPEDAELTVVKSGVEYVRQFSTSPIMDSDQMSTIL